MGISTGKPRLRDALAANGLTLTQVANACGVSRGAVGQWFIDGAGARPIPARHMATIRELLAEPTKVASQHPRRSEPQPALGIGEIVTQLASAMPGLTGETRHPPAIPARRPRRAPLGTPPPPQPMHWGAPPFLGQEPAPPSPVHYPGHWAQPPVMPPPAPAYISPAAGPRHSDIVAAHNRATQHGATPDVRSGATPEFPLAQFFGLTMPIRREDREAFEAQLTRHAIENGFEDAPELRMVIEALRTAVRLHNQKFGH